MRTRQEIESQLRADCTTIDGEVAGHPHYEALIERWTDREEAKESIATVRGWPSVAEFYAEFYDAEIYGIETSAAPAVIVAKGKLMAWRGEVLANDPRIIAGMRALIDAGIISEARRSEILGS